MRHFATNVRRTETHAQLVERVTRRRAAAFAQARLARLLRRHVLTVLPLP